MNKKNNYLTVLSVISCVAVIYLHSNFVIWDNVYTSYFFTSNIIRSIFYFAVPVFFMITGATLLDYNEKYSTKDFFVKRIKKTLIPFIIFSFFALFFKVITCDIKIDDLNLLSIVNGILTTKFNDVYWYFIFLFKVYLIIPIFASLNKKIKNKILMYLAFIMFVFNIFIPFIIDLFNLNIINPIYIFGDNGYILYVICGYLFHNLSIDVKKIYLIYFCGFMCLLLMIIGGYYVSLHTGSFNELFHSYLGLPCMIYSISIFIFCKYNCDIFYKFKNVNKLFLFLSKYTFSIYLVHMYIIHIIVNFLKLDIYSIFYRTLFPFPVILISVVLIYLLRKIKFIRFVLPE